MFTFFVNLPFHSKKKNNFNKPSPKYSRVFQKIKPVQNLETKLLLELVRTNYGQLTLG